MSSQTDGHCWIWWDEQRHAQVSFTKPLPRHEAVEYMRVLSRKEVEKLANDEGVDVQQLLNSYRRTIEGQKRHIATLEGQLNNAINELTVRALND